MRRLPIFLRWLALAALTDWLVTRTLARAAIFMPKSPPVLTAYQVVVAAGQVASVLAALLALAGMLWLALQFGQARGSHPVLRGALSIALFALVGISLVLQVVLPGALLQLTYHMLILGVIFWMLIYAVRWEAVLAQKAVVILAGAALLLGGLFQSIQIVSQVLGWSEPPEFTLALFNLGEVMVVLSPAPAWWGLRRSGWKNLLCPGGSSSATAGHQIGNSSAGHRMSSGIDGPGWSTYLWAAMPALGFSALTILNPAMAGVLSIWSTGLTLFLPWPFYALSLWLLSALVIASWRSGEPTGWALLLLAAGGYAPQLSSQVFFGLIGLTLLCRLIPRATQEDSAAPVISLVSNAVESR